MGAPALWENLMPMKKLVFGIAVIAMICVMSAQAQTWKQVGPTGGTVISLAADPNNISKMFLGTADGHVPAGREQAGWY